MDNRMPFNGDYIDSDGKVRNLIENGTAPADHPKNYMMPFNGNFYASDGSVHHIAELLNNGGSGVGISPHLWDIDTEIDLGDGSFGKRIVRKVYNDAEKQETFDISGKIRIIDYGGDIIVNLLPQANESYYQTPVNTYPEHNFTGVIKSYFYQSNLVILTQPEIEPFKDGTVDCWIRYTKE